MSCGIYQILNTLTGKCYVGKSSCIIKRWRDHLVDLRRNEHPSLKLQNAWNKYGESSFKFEVLQECSKIRLLWLEPFWMAKLSSLDKGYNIRKITLDGQEYPSGIKYDESRIHRGWHHTEETKKKLRKPKSEEHKAKLRKPKSEEMKKKMYRLHKGKILSEDHRLAIIQANTGSKRSKETKAKMREAWENGKFANRPAITEETRMKLSKVSKNRKYGERSEETKAKMREAWIRRKLRKEVA